MQLLIQYNADFHVKDKYGCTALYGAALKGCHAMVQLLLHEGADPNAQDKDELTRLYVAALERCRGIVQIPLRSLTMDRQY